MVDLGFVLFQRYDGDVGDLGLTLSYDEDVMGQVETIFFSLNAGKQNCSFNLNTLFMFPGSWSVTS